MAGGSLKGRISRTGSISGTDGKPESPVTEGLLRDIYSFGEVILEILTSGRVTNGRASSQSILRESILVETYNQDEAGLKNAVKEEVKVVLEVALLCINSRPSMEDALGLLSGLTATQKELVGKLTTWII